MDLEMLDKRALNALKPKVKHFVLEWLLDKNGKRAAIAVGYSAKTADVKAAQLLAMPEVKLAVAKCGEMIVQHFDVQLHEIQEQLYFAVTRNAKDFCDPDTGEIITDIHKLGKRACGVIDGIKQKKHIYTDKDGNEKVTLETELKLVPKAAAIDMAMKYRGMYAPQKSEVVSVQFPFDQLYQAPTPPKDPVQLALEQVSSQEVTEEAHNEQGKAAKKVSAKVSKHRGGGNNHTNGSASST